MQNPCFLSSLYFVRIFKKDSGEKEMFKKTTVRALFFGAVLALSAIPALGWDETGHKITAYIAWQTMTPDVRERVIKILTEAPEDSDLSTFYLTYGSTTPEKRKREYFMLVATWADIVRDRKFDTRYKKYHKGNWHYDDAFWTMRDGKIEYLKAPDDGGQALARLVEFDKLIRGSATDAQKAIAIAWMEHLIGDLHQPLHTSARVTDIEPKGDQGGNLFLLTPKDTPRDKQQNLHSFWDGIIGKNMPNSKDECDAVYLDPIAQKIIKMHPLAKMRARLAVGQFELWVKESLTAAQTDVYSADLKRFEAATPKYKKRALEVSQERLALAGYRMGDLFNQVFGGVPAPK